MTETISIEQRFENLKQYQGPVFRHAPKIPHTKVVLPLPSIFFLPIGLTFLLNPGLSRFAVLNPKPKLYQAPSCFFILVFVILAWVSKQRVLLAHNDMAHHAVITFGGWV